MKKTLLCFTALSLLATYQSFANAGNLLQVAVDLNLGDLYNKGYPSQNFSDLYNSLDNVVSSRVSSPPGSDIDLYLSYPRSSFSSTDTTQITSYLNEGGRVVLFAEHNGTRGSGSATTNIALEMIGSSMRFDQSPTIDGGGHGQTRTGQILDSTFTHGVDVLTYAGADSVSGGTPLVLASDMQSPIISYEQIGNGILFAIGDTNFVDTLDDGLFQGRPDQNRVLFENLLIQPIPEPSDIASFLGLFVGLFVCLNRRAKSANQVEHSTR